MATKKLDKEHLEQINDLRERYAENANKLGNLQIEEFSLTRRFDEIDTLRKTELSVFETIRLQEQDLISKLNERYGDGEIDAETGTFTHS